MSHVAITGVSGHIAQILLPLLENDTELDRVIGIDLVPPALEVSKLVFHNCDVRDPRIEELFFGVDTVVHLAFMIFHNYGDDARADDVNINGNINVFEAAARANARKLVVASSIAAYGIHPENDQPLTEESPIRGNEDFYYARAKSMIEKYLDLFCCRHRSMIVTRLRFCIVVGPSTDPARHIAYKSRLYCKARGDEQRANLLHESDAASAIYLALKRDVHGAYNVAGPQPELPSELARSIGMRVVTIPRFALRALGFYVRLQWRRGKISIPPVWMHVAGRGPMCVSTAKIEHELGWRPDYTTRQAFMETFADQKRPQQERTRGTR